MNNGINDDIVDNICDLRIDVNSSYSYPGIILDYLWVWGIELGFSANSYTYHGEVLDVDVTDNVLTLRSKKESCDVAVILLNNYNVYLRKNMYQFSGCHSTASITRIGQKGICYERDGRIYDLVVVSDVLGNIDIIYRNDTIEKKVSICVGNYRGTKMGYLDTLRREIDNTIHPDDIKMVNVMFNDPRIIQRISDLMTNMAPSIDLAYQKKVNEIKSKYQDQIEELILKQREEVGELSRYKDEYIKSLCGESLDEGKIK